MFIALLYVLGTLTRNGYTDFVKNKIKYFVKKRVKGLNAASQIVLCFGHSIGESQGTDFDMVNISILGGCLKSQETAWKS